MLTIHCSVPLSLCRCEIFCHYTDQPLFCFADFCRCEFVVRCYHANGFLLFANIRFWWCEFMDDYFISHGIALYLVSHRLFPSSLVCCINSMSASDIQDERRPTLNAGRKHAGSGALQMGPRKKPYVLLLI